MRAQEELGLDVLVHGEAERNDMVEYFGELLEGYALTEHGWVQSYGSRCVKPPILYGDVRRPEPMTTKWITFAQSLTDKPVKAMLTGPVTMLNWSFVRDDQPRSVTCRGRGAVAAKLRVNQAAIDLRRQSSRVHRPDVQAAAEPGDDIVLTIDADLQRFAMERFGEESGAAVVMDIHTGEILSLVSNPGYDPNWFNVGITQAQWRQLNGDKYKPLINKAIQGQYPPGSTFKMLVGLAALEAGTATPDTRVFCPGHMEFGNNTFHCWKKGGHGTMGLVSAIEESCDVYFYEIARRT